MTFDTEGRIWLSDLWMALVVCSLVLGLVIWSHRWIVMGRMPRPRAMAVRMPRAQRLQPSLRLPRLRSAPANEPTARPMAGAVLEIRSRQPEDRKAA